MHKCYRKTPSHQKEQLSNALEMGQWIKKVFAYDGMFFQMFPLYSSSLRVKMIYLEKLESEHETASIKTMVKNSVNTKMWIFCYYPSKNTSTNHHICQKKCWIWWSGWACVAWSLLGWWWNMLIMELTEAFYAFMAVS